MKILVAPRGVARMSFCFAWKADKAGKLEKLNRRNAPAAISDGAGMNE